MQGHTYLFVCPVDKGAGLGWVSDSNPSSLALFCILTFMGSQRRLVWCSVVLKLEEWLGLLSALRRGGPSGDRSPSK